MVVIPDLSGAIDEAFMVSGFARSRLFSFGSVDHLERLNRTECFLVTGVARKAYRFAGREGVLENLR